MFKYFLLHNGIRFNYKYFVVLGMNHQTKSGSKIVAFSNRFLTNKKGNEIQGQLKGFYFNFSNIKFFFNVQFLLFTLSIFLKNGCLVRTFVIINIIKKLSLIVLLK